MLPYLFYSNFPDCSRKKTIASDNHAMYAHRNIVLYVTFQRYSKQKKVCVR